MKCLVKGYHPYHRWTKGQALMSLQPDLSPHLPTYYHFFQMYPRPQPPGNTPDGLGLVFYVTNKGSHLLHSLHITQGQTKRTWHISKAQQRSTQQKAPYILKLYRWTYLQNRKRLTDLESELKDVGGGRDWEKRYLREFWMDTYTLLYLKWINYKDLLYSTWNSA